MILLNALFFERYARLNKIAVQEIQNGDLYPRSQKTLDDIQEARQMNYECENDLRAKFLNEETIN